jgi:hypothetical protein
MEYKTCWISRRMPEAAILTFFSRTRRRSACLYIKIGRVRVSKKTAGAFLDKTLPASTSTFSIDRFPLLRPASLVSGGSGEPNLCVKFLVKGVFLID